jgi:hypothetical protein
MATLPLKLFVVLKQIRYSGSNIGSDLSFAFDTNGEIDFIKPKIGFGQSIPVDIVLWRKPAIEGETVKIHVKTLVTEEDWAFSDIGEGEAFLVMKSPAQIPKVMNFK